MRLTASVMAFPVAAAFTANAIAGLTNAQPVTVGDQIYWVQNAKSPWSLNVAGSPPCRFQFELRAGDRWVFENQPAVERSEMQGPTDSTDPAIFDAPVWTAYQFRIAPGPPSTAAWVVLGDWHVRPDPGDTAIMASPWQLELRRGDILSFNTHSSTEKPVRDIAPNRYLWQSSAPLVRGVWHSIVSMADFDWRPGGEGAVVVWLDDEKIVNYRGSFGYNNTKPPYFKFGIYRSAAPETLVVDYANIETSRTSLAWRIRKPPAICEGNSYK